MNTTRARRLDTLHTAEVARWKARWDAYHDATWGALDEHTLDNVAAWDDDEAAPSDAVYTWAAVATLDADAWNAWFARCQSRTPFRDDTGEYPGVDLSLWPHLLPAPPDEPPGAFERLRGKDRAPDTHGRAASLVLLRLSEARAVRTARAEHAQPLHR